MNKLNTDMKIQEIKIENIQNDVYLLNFAFNSFRSTFYSQLSMRAGSVFSLADVLIFKEVACQNFSSVYESLSLAPSLAPSLPPSLAPSLILSLSPPLLLPSLAFSLYYYICTIFSIKIKHEISKNLENLLFLGALKANWHITI